MGLLDGKVALVTGAGGGLGETHALLLAKEGAAVVVNDLGGSRDGAGGGSAMADTVVEKIKAMGGQAIADYGNVAKEEDAVAMVQKAVDTFGKLDFLIANAGILRDKSFKNMTNEMWDIVIEVHLRGTYLTVKAAYNQMMNQEDGGSIVVTSSTSGLLGNFGQSNYGAAKAGMNAMGQSLAQALISENIFVYTVAPGFVETHMAAKILGSPEGNQIRSQSPAGRVARPEEIANTIRYLAMEAPEFMSGCIVDVNGASYLRS